jgi:hypothetical protein
MQPVSAQSATPIKTGSSDAYIWTSFGEGLTQLLDDPVGCRVASHVEVEYPVPPVLDHKEAVQQLKRHRWHSEEVECGDDFAMTL